MRQSAPIVLAPFANDRMREWPPSNFQRFIDRGLEEGRTFQIIGALNQRPMADEIVRRYPADQVANLCGSITWPEVEKTIVSAAFVVTNNSGLGHVAAALGQWVLCIFSGRHSWIEWMPRGPRVVTLARMPECAPCDYGFCPNQFNCMEMLDPDFAFDEITRAIAEREAENTAVAS
jgi:ADP-heptose:LPS heptosyltransferase